MFNINKDKKYLVAVSGGPDSMALLDMSYKMNLKIMVAHLNYHKRDSALRDEIIVYNYCLNKNIPFIKMDVSTKCRGNFQDYARVVRYKFFSKICRQYNLDGVLVAHHLDDLLETYLLQVNRGGIVDYYGLKEETVIQKINIYRPLLAYTKDELLNYCLTNKIEYGIDESNLTDHYTRNKIRHNIIEKYNKSQKEDLLKEINLKNDELLKERKTIIDYLDNRKRISFEEFHNFKNKKALLRQLIEYDLSDKYLSDLVKQLDNSRKVTCLIKDKYIVKEYDYIEIFKKPKNYSYVYENIKYDKHKYYKAVKTGNNFNGVSLLAEDFPITIRNYREGDYITMRYGKKKLSRYFIDKKIPFKERISYPVVLNKNGEVVLVPGIGCASSRFSIKHNLFVIKL